MGNKSWYILCLLCWMNFFQTNLEDPDIAFGNVLFGNPLLNHLDLIPFGCTLTLALSDIELLRATVAVIMPSQQLGHCLHTCQNSDCGLELGCGFSSPVLCAACCWAGEAVMIV